MEVSTQRLAIMALSDDVEVHERAQNTVEILLPWLVIACSLPVLILTCRRLVRESAFIIT